MRLTLLHTNDVHGRIDGLARVATLVERVRAERPHPVLYADAGDVEEASVRISSLTKGVAMHRLLSAAGCDVACAGNATWLRYGPQVLPEQAAVATYPLLLANLRPVEGVQATALLGGVGFVGVTDPFRGFIADGLHGIEADDEVETVRRHARELRSRGAELVVCLSHLGLDVADGRTDRVVTDRMLAPEVQGDVDVIVGAHTHDLLPEGERIGEILVAQAGSHAEWLGVVEVDGDRVEASLLEVGEDVPPHPAVLAEAARVERELEAWLDDPLAELAQPLDCAWIAERLRRRLEADVAVLAEGDTLARTLGPGPLTRGQLWEACETTANPGVTTMTGAQLAHVLARGADPAFQDETPHTLRGRRRGRLFVAGRTDVEHDARVRVAGTDWELEPYGGLVEPGWQLEVRYEFPTILREAVADELQRLERTVVEGDAVAPEGAAGGEQPLA